MPEEEKIILTFTKAYATKKKIRYDEDLGEFAWSSKDVAIGYIYPLAEAMELIGSPEKIRVTIEPVKPV